MILNRHDWIKVKTFDGNNRDFRVYKFLKYIKDNDLYKDKIFNIIKSRNLVSKIY